MSVLSKCGGRAYADRRQLGSTGLVRPAVPHTPVVPLYARHTPPRTSRKSHGSGAAGNAGDILDLQGSLTWIAVKSIRTPCSQASSPTLTSWALGHCNIPQPFINEDIEVVADELGVSDRVGAAQLLGIAFFTAVMLGVRFSFMLS